MSLLLALGSGTPATALAAPAIAAFSDAAGGATGDAHVGSLRAHGSFNAALGGAKGDAAVGTAPALASFLAAPGHAFASGGVQAATALAAPALATFSIAPGVGHTYGFVSGAGARARRRPATVGASPATTSASAASVLARGGIAAFALASPACARSSAASVFTLGAAFAGAASAVASASVHAHARGYINPSDEELARMLSLALDPVAKSAELLDRDRPLAIECRDALHVACAAFFGAHARALAMKLRGETHKAAGGADDSADDRDHLANAADAIDYEPLRKEVAPVLARLAQDGARQGLAQIDAEIAVLLDQANEQAIAWAHDRAAELAKGLDETTRGLVRTLVEAALDEGWSNDRLADELEASEAFSEARADRIARTETAFADVQGNLIGYRASGIVEGKEWIVGTGCCDICEVLRGEVVPLDETFSDGTEAPPQHPNCRCDVLPVLREEEE